MPRPRQNLVMRSFRLREGATDELARFYPQIGVSRVIRYLIEEHLKSLQAREQQTLAEHRSEMDKLTSIQITPEEIQAAAQSDAE